MQKLKFMVEDFNSHKKCYILSFCCKKPTSIFWYRINDKHSIMKGEGFYEKSGTDVGT